MSRCKHFNGIRNDACDIGIVYDSVRLPPNGTIGQRIPCVRPDGKEYCGMCVFPTNEEQAAEDAQRTKSIEATMKVMAAVREQNSPSGKLPCPLCECVVTFWIASNGHIRALCETPNCIAFMQ